MENLEETDVELLRNSVENKFGRKITYAKDCGELSETVFETTGNKVSETTLKRLWNLVNSTFNPSKYTLNSLAKYLKFSDFDDFITHKNDYRKSAENMLIWTQLKDEAMKISKNIFFGIKNSLGVNYEKTIHRAFFNEKISEFLESEKTAYALVGPTGFGKTTALAQIAEKYFINADTNDICWYFTCSNTPANTLNKDLNNVFAKLSGSSGQTSYKEYFEKHPATLNGKIVLILDEISSIETADIAMNIVSAYKNEKYLKLIVSMNPLLWQYIDKTIKEINKSCWFEAQWNIASSSFSNIPHLSPIEMQQILKNCNCLTPRNFEILHKESMDNVFSIPYYLELLISLSQKNLTETLLYETFNKRKIDIKSYDNKTQKFIDFFLFTTNYGFESETADKNRLTRLIEEYGKEFRELLSTGILTEFSSTDKDGKRLTLLKFSSKKFFAFQLANYWLKEFGLNESLFMEVSSYYSENPEMKLMIFGWFLRYAFYEKNIKLLKSFFRLTNIHFKDDEVNCKKLKELFCTEIRYYPELQDSLLQTEEEREFYFQEYPDFDNINGFYIRYTDIFCSTSDNSHEKLLPLTQKAYILFNEGHYKDVDEIFSLIQEIDTEEDEDFDLLLRLCVELLADYGRSKKINAKLSSYVENFFKEYYSEKKAGKISKTECMAIDVLLMTKCFKTAKSVIEKLFPSNDTDPEDFCYKHLKLRYSYALMKMNYAQKAIQIFQENKDGFIDLIPCNSFNTTLKTYYEIIKYITKKPLPEDLPDIF